MEKADADNKAAIEAQIAALEAELEEADAENKAVIEAQIAALQTALEKADADNKAAIEAQIATLKTELEAADAADKKVIEDKIEKLNTDLSALIKANTEAIDALEETAADLQKQITDTNTKIDSIKTELEGKIDASEKKVLDELNDLKTSIEGQITAVNPNIADLKAKDIELETKIADLKAYVDGEIEGTEDWANATFATLTQYEAVQTTIAGIKTDIENINAKIEAIETDVATKVAAINASIAGLDSRLAEKVTEVTDCYTTAVASAKTEITAAYTKAIADAITASETAMKAWVNETLANGYYDIAAIDAKLKAITDVAATDEELAAAVAAQQAALEQAKADLEAAYMAAINDAIETNNGVIRSEIAKAVQDAIDVMSMKLAVIENSITAMELRVANLELQVETNAARIEALEKKIAELEEKLAAQSKCLAGEHAYTYKDNGDGTHSESGCKNCSAAITGEPAAHTYTDGACPTCGAVEPAQPTGSYYDQQTNTYVVYDAQGLYAWNTAVQSDPSANLMLMSSITLPNVDVTTGETITVTDGIPSGSNWTVFGTGSNPYAGTVEGNGYAVTGLRINSAASYVGFVGLGENSLIQNLELVDPIVYGSKSTGPVGAICGVLNYGSSGTSVISCKVSGGSVSGQYYTGGIVGQASSSHVTECTVTDCTVQGLKEGRGSAVGGIVGLYNSGSMQACMFLDGSVTGKADFAGGIVGKLIGNTKVAVCGNTGTVSGTGTVGGICGYYELKTTTKPVLASCWTIKDGIVETDGGDDGVGGSNRAEIPGVNLVNCFAGNQYDMNYTYISAMNSGLGALSFANYRWQEGADINNDWPVPVKYEG